MIPVNRTAMNQGCKLFKFIAEVKKNSNGNEKKIPIVFNTSSINIYIPPQCHIQHIKLSLPSNIKELNSQVKPKIKFRY